LTFAKLILKPFSATHIINTILHMNLLKYETSPYLLQHANNPVHWLAWNDESLQKAKDENKIMLVSIGYSACHWCHVMEHECFENDFLAKLMNEHFICIKVDREERPDIDNIYMNAVQLMTGRGGWPLNCFTLPDGSPIYGGTYFNSEQWYSVLNSIAEAWNENREQTIEYAQKLKQGMKVSNEHFISADKSDAKLILQESLEHWKRRFDEVYGGPNKSPKFPLPCNYQYLLHHALYRNDEAILQHVHLTLQRMAKGGIYDQLEGGFARYSVDAMWKVPHFEKMLYDNAQLIELYSLAYRYSKLEYYKQIAEETIQFIRTYWSTESGLFASAFDADSEGEEGKFYVFTESEIDIIIQQKQLQTEADEIKKHFGINATGFWEHDNYVLHACTNASQEEVLRWRDALLEVRKKRVMPSLDDKQLCSWNALLCKALVQASIAFNEDRYAQQAITLYQHIKQHLMLDDGHLLRTHKHGKSHIAAFLEDYATCIEAAISLFEVTSNQLYIEDAERWLSICNYEFIHADGSLYYYTSIHQADIIMRQADLQDNVIPASNSIMAWSIFMLGHIQSNPKYLAQAKQMCAYAMAQIGNYAEAYANWCRLMLQMEQGLSEIVICGEKAHHYQKELYKIVGPGSVIYATEKPNAAKPFEDRYEADKTSFYLCKHQTCSIVEHDFEEFLKGILESK
jgi:uncharacterized protein YyaL (SSP411 family)